MQREALNNDSFRAVLSDRKWAGIRQQVSDLFIVNL